MSFFEELKRRNVVRVGIAYVVAAWLLLQLTEVLTELLEIGPEVGKIVILLLIIGFIPALIFAWAFELTPEGIKRDSDVERNQSITPQTGRKLDFIIIGMLVLIAGYFIWEARFMQREPAAPATQPEAITQTTAPAPAQQPAADLGNSIAVLPFANRSMAEEDSFFTEGIHDDLLTQLAKINDLKVISRTSMMKYKGTEKTIPEIAEELQVSTILEGGVQRAGKRIRINAQLIDVSTDQHLWAETFDREMTVENIFDIQSEITRQIVQAVRGELTEDEQLRLARVPTNNLEAYEAYLQALSLVNAANYAQSNYEQAEVWATRAVELDPEFAQAWAMLVEINGQAIWLGYDTAHDRQVRAKTALDNAKRLGPGLPETIAAEADYAYRIEQDFEHALVLYQQAHQLLPGDASLLYNVALAQRRTPDVEGAVQSLLQTLVIDPHFSKSPPALLETLAAMGDFERAEPLVNRWALQFPDVSDIKVWQAEIQRGLGNIELSRSLFESITPYESSAYLDLADEFYFFARDMQKARETLQAPFMQPFLANRGGLGFADVMMGWTYLLDNQLAKAKEHLRASIEAITSTPPSNSYQDSFELINLAYAYALNDQPELAVDAADRALVIVNEDNNQLFGSWIAQWRTHVLALAGQRDEALAEIERLLATPYRFSKWELYLDSRWDFFRDDERFNALIRPEGVE